MKPEPIFPQYERYLSDESRLKGHADAIVFPKDAGELAATLRSASQSGMPVTLQGACTGLSGGAVPRGGLVVNLSRMNGINGINGLGPSGDRALLHVQAGVTLERIEAEAAHHGLFFPPNPSEKTATIGGMYATGASGISGIRFGEMSRYVEDLTWVTLAGEIWSVRRGERLFSKKGCALPDGRLLEGSLAGAEEGRDLVDFLAGNEGRLGAAAEFRLLLLPEPRDCWGAVFFFREDDAAHAFARALYGWRRAHAELLYAAEYFNERALEFIAGGNERGGKASALPGFPKGAKSALYVEIRGDDPEELLRALEAQLGMFMEVGGSDDCTWAENGPGVRKLRDMRHRLVERIGAKPCAPDGGGKLSACFSAAPERFADCLEIYEKGLTESGLPGALYGHLFENVLHMSLAPRDESGREVCIKLLRALARAAEENGGASPDEYGEGRRERPWADSAACKGRAARKKALAAFFGARGLM